MKGSDGQSYLGVAFHGLVTAEVGAYTFDNIYFRPFNFGNSSGHSVQYTSLRK